MCGCIDANWRPKAKISNNYLTEFSKFSGAKIFGKVLNSSTSNYEKTKKQKNFKEI